jgi:hypothetical protein
MLLSDRRLLKAEGVVLDQLITRALRLARAADRADFATTYLAAVPQGPAAGQVWADLDQLSVSELWQLARSGNAALPDIEGRAAGQLRQLAMEHA